MNAILLLALLPVLSSGQAVDDASCALQTALAQGHSEKDKEEANTPDKTAKCKLPGNAKWCTVTLGAASFPMAVYGASDIVSDQICQSGTWELAADDIRNLGSPGHALDIGANVGFYTLVLAAAGWTVTAFEPMAANTDLIEASMCANPDFKTRITLNKFGLGSKDDHCVIWSGDDNLGDGISNCGQDAKASPPPGYQKRADFHIRKLDDVLSEQGVKKIDFVKMDVEGFECQVMAGGQSLLTKFRPREIQSEVWPTMQGCLPKDYLASFDKASYKVSKDRACISQGGLNSPKGIVDRFMCREKGVSHLEAGATLEPNERTTVWHKPA